MRDAPLPRYVILHTPGPAWHSGVDFREQPGVRDHVLYYRGLFDQGQLELGSPFPVADLGGMMVTKHGLDRAEIEAFAAADPGVQSRLLRYEVRAWHTPFEG